MTDVKVLILFLVLLVAGAMAFAELSEQDCYSEFRKANDLFRRGNEAVGSSGEAERLYSQAILHYEKIVNEGGIKNAKLYYDLGNSYLLKDDVGMAILNYRRALRLEPTNHDIHKNLNFARGRRIDTVEVKTQKRLLQTLFFWHYDFSVKARFFTACVFFAILFIALTVMLWIGRRGGLVLICVAAGILASCFYGSVAIEYLGQANRLCGVITSSSVTARQGDGMNYPVSFKTDLHAGTEFDLVEHRSGWMNIELSDGSTGWVPDKSAELLNQ